MRKIAFLLLVLIIAGCGNQRKLNEALKSPNPNYKLTVAKEFYAAEDFFRALPLLENLVPVTKGSRLGEEVYYYYAKTHYNLKDYYLAGYYLKNFAKIYPVSEQAEECAFLGAYCSYLLSPDPSLDQEETYDALTDFQIFLNKFPETAKKDTCNQLIDNLLTKLEDKAYANASLYYQIGEYKAASVALADMLEKYPNSKYKEDLLFLILKSKFKLAENSVEYKKETRFKETIKSYHIFVAAFPESKMVKEANDYKMFAENELADLQKNKK